MAGGDRKSADHALALALANGNTIQAAAIKSGVSERSAHRRLKTPAFQQLLSDIKGDMVRRTTARLTRDAAKAVSTLHSLLAAKGAKGEKVRLGAAVKIIELGGKLRDSTELEERLAAVEALLKEQADASLDRAPNQPPGDASQASDANQESAAAETGERPGAGDDPLWDEAGSMADESPPIAG